MKLIITVLATAPRSTPKVSTKTLDLLQTSRLSSQPSSIQIAKLFCSNWFRAQIQHIACALRHLCMDMVSIILVLANYLFIVYLLVYNFTNFSKQISKRTFCALSRANMV